MPTGCIRCSAEINELHSICHDCAESLFSDNLFWVIRSALIHSPVIDRYKEDSRGFLRIGDHPGDEIVFKEEPSTLEEVRSYSVDEMNPDDYNRVKKRLNTILAELGVTKVYDPESYFFSAADAEVFSEIFYLVEDLEHKFSNRKGCPSLYNRIGNLFQYSLSEADKSVFDMEFRERIVKDLFEEAEGYYELAIQDSEEDPAIFCNKGRLYLEMERYGKAEDCFKKIIDLRPEDLQAKLDLCETELGEEELKTAEKKLNELAQDNEDDPRIWYLKGEIAKEDGRWGGAIQFYNQALRLEEYYKDALLKKCSILLEREKYPQANSLYDDYIEDNGDDPKAWYGKAKALLGLDKWGGAVQCINEALLLDPQYAEAWVTRGDILEERGDHGSAIDAYENALKINPDLQEAKEGKSRIKKKIE